MEIIEAFAAKKQVLSGGRARCVRLWQTKWFPQTD